MTRGLSADEAEKLGAGRASLLRIRPYFAAALLAMEPYACDEIETFAVDDRWRLYINPRRLHEWSAAEIGVVLEHELGHLLRRHHDRAVLSHVAPHQSLLWNVACDAAINDDLLATGRILPGNPVLPSDIGMDPYLPEEQYFHGLVSAASLTTSVGGALPNCGSAVDGSQRGYESDAGGIGTAEKELLRRVTASSIRSAGASAPPQWRRWAAAASSPPLMDWETLLAGATLSMVASLGGDRRSYHKPHRRVSETDVITQGRVRATPRVAIVVDVSGSMSRSALGVVTGELMAMSHAGMIDDPVVIACDTEVRIVEPLSVARSWNLRGAGGTDLRVAIAAAEQHCADGTIVFTDGETPWPSKPSRGALLVVLVRAGEPARRAVPRWAKIVDLPVI